MKKLVPTTVKVSELYEMIRARKADLAMLQTSMQQITGDATPAWEDTVMSELQNNVTLNTLYTKYKYLSRSVNHLLESTVTIEMYIRETDQTDGEAVETEE